MNRQKILVIDETIREGMQFQGVMFSPEQRIRILEFQEELNIDVCQAGYPPAHDSEFSAVRRLVRYAREKKLNIRIAAMGRADMKDAEILISSLADDFHFHVHIPDTTPENKLEDILASLQGLIQYLKTRHPEHGISLAMLDIGRCSAEMLDRCTTFFEKQQLHILSLPDTSGLLSPLQIYDQIKRLSNLCSHTAISIHCHNDMGMASANSVAGICAGAGVLEASALGIGERNGIADLYTAGKSLQDQGYELALNTDDTDTFQAYYEYIDAIVFEQTGIRLLNPCTPVFGHASATHVAGTHSGGEFGRAGNENFRLNVLCGKHLVKKYLDVHELNFPEEKTHDLTLKIKDKSARLNRPLYLADVKKIIDLL